MNFSKFLSTLFLSGFLATSGCMIRANKKIETDSPIYPEAGFRAGVELIDYEVKELGDKIQTTGVHPDDWFLSGTTTTDLEGKSSKDFVPKLGLEASLGWDFLRVYTGVDARVHSLSSKNHTVDLYDNPQQSSDIRPSSQGSFVYSKLSTEPFSFVPFVGVEGVIAEKIHLGFEIGKPYMGWKMERGHDRWSHHQKVHEETWNGFGKRIGGFAGFSIDDSDSNLDRLLIGLYVGKESYEPEFAGEKGKIEGVVYMLQARARF